MDIKEVFKSQYHAALAMLKQAIKNCPDSLWTDPKYKNQFWHIAYHVIFYIHFYLHKSEKDYIPWPKHRDQYQFMGRLPWPPHDPPNIGEPAGKDEVLEYLNFCREQIDAMVDALDLEAESGFYWLPFGKTELQIYNIRHIQHHAGQLIDRIRNETEIESNWIGIKPEKN
jgi:hypothetical protein